jgi:tRNA(Arg) A34 adenosine deaminase TadA
MNHSLTAIIKDKRGNVLAIGKNSYTKTHPYQAKCAKEVGLPEKIYLHAEIQAILKCKDLTKAHSIHVFRYGRQNTALNAKPCKICAQAIKIAGIKEIYHT